MYSPMKLRQEARMKALAIFAALAATAASAGYEVVRTDPVTGIQRIEYVDTPLVVPIETTTTVYEERVIPRERIIVSSDYIYRFPADEILSRPGYPDLSGYPDRTSALNPQTGQLIGYGLFNRAGPNDFGR
jgi:hypothetical protein